MARQARVQYAGARYHVINRGNYRKDLFRTHKTDEVFTKVLLETCERFEWWLHAYVIMSNHYHLCVETPHANLSQGIHWLQSSFSNKFSKFTGERGHVFQGRYKSLLIEDEFYLLNVVDYIHLNPVRAGIVGVDQLREYENSSFPKYFSKYRHARLKCDEFLGEAGIRISSQAMRSYHNRLRLIMEEDPGEREKLFSGLSSGWYIGGEKGMQVLQQKIDSGEAQANAMSRSELSSNSAEALIVEGLRTLGKDEQALLKEKKSEEWKLALACWIKARSTLRNAEIAQRLNMGHPANMSALVTRYSRDRQSVCGYFGRLKALK